MKLSHTLPSDQTQTLAAKNTRQEPMCIDAKDQMQHPDDISSVARHQSGLLIEAHAQTQRLGFLQP